MRKILLFLFLFSTFTFITQVGTATNESENILIDEKFNDNSNGWLVGENDYFSAKMENSDLIYRNKQTSAQHTNRITLPLDQEKDFSIETKLDNIEGSNQNGYGMIWGYLDYKNFFMLNITNSQYYQIIKYQDGKYHELEKWSVNVYLNTDSPNKLLIEKKDNKYFFEMNDIKITNVPFEKFFGNDLGLIIWNEKAIKVDYFKVKGTKAIIQKDKTPESSNYFEDLSKNVFGNYENFNYTQKFQKAFKEIVGSAKEKFKGTFSESDSIKISYINYNKLITEFPSSKYSYFKENIKYGYAYDIDEITYNIIVYYDATAGKSTFLWDNEEYNRIYSKLVKELLECKSSNIGGSWKISQNDSSGFEMVSENEPMLKVYLRVSGTTGLDLVFRLKRMF